VSTPSSYFTLEAVDLYVIVGAKAEDFSVCPDGKLKRKISDLSSTDLLNSITSGSALTNILYRTADCEYPHHSSFVIFMSL
jgi:hypothetical protein